MIMFVIMACMILHSSLWMRSSMGKFQPENIGLNLNGVLQGTHLLYQGRTPSVAAKL